MGALASRSSTSSRPKAMPPAGPAGAGTPRPAVRSPAGRHGQRPGQRIVVAGAAEHRIQVGHVRIDVRRRAPRFRARLQRRIEARVVQQGAQLVVQHLQLAQAGVDRRGPAGRASARSRCAAAAGPARDGGTGPTAGAAAGRGPAWTADRRRRRSRRAGAPPRSPQQRHEVAAGGAPGLQQRVLLHVVGATRAVATGWRSASSAASAGLPSNCAPAWAGRMQPHARLRPASGARRREDEGEHQQVFRQIRGSGLPSRPKRAR